MPELIGTKAKAAVVSFCLLQVIKLSQRGVCGGLQIDFSISSDLDNVSIL